MPVFLLRYIPHLIIIFSVIGATWYLVNSVYALGRIAERAGWQERESGRIAMQTQLVAEAEKKNASERDLRYSNLMGVVNAQAKLNNDLQSDLDSIAGKRLYISTKTCGNDSGSVPGASQNTGKLSGRSGRAELSWQDAENIRLDYADAQRVVNQYLLCRQALIGIADIAD
jgi:hypothetical protein